MFVVEVEARRLENGLCVGHVLTRIMGIVILPERLDRTVISAIGSVDAWTIWSNDNLNNYVLDHVKKYTNEWTKIGLAAPNLD